MTLALCGIASIIALAGFGWFLLAWRTEIARHEATVYRIVHAKPPSSAVEEFPEIVQFRARQVLP